MAKGVQRKYYYGKVAVTFGKELFAEINEISERENRSFASVVRSLCNQALKQ